MTIAILFLYLLVLIFIAYKSYGNIQNHNDFFVARKKGNYRSITGSLLATILGGSAVIGSIDAGQKMGWATAWYMLSAAIGLLALLPLTRRISKLGRFTLPDLLEDIYGIQTKKIASVIIPIAWLGIVAAQIIASARILQSFTTINYQTGVIVSGVVFIAYTIAGGQISILKTDFIQSILIIAGLGALSFFAIHHTGIKPEVISPLKFPFNTTFKPFDLLILLVTYSTTFTAGPDIYSRIFCASDEKTAQRSVLTTALILIPIAFIIGYLSVFGTHLPHLTGSGSVLVEISKTVLPFWALPIVVIALLSAVLSSADTTILSSSIILTDLVQKNKIDQNSLKISRIVILITGMISILIALQFSSIIGMLLIALSVYSGAFILPVLVGLTSVKIKANFVSTAIITGGALALIGKLFYYNGQSNLGNYIILSAFIANGTLLFLGRKKNL